MTASQLRRLLLALFALMLPLSVSAQDEVEYTMEIGGGVGLASGLTDVNSKLFGGGGAAAELVYRYHFNPRSALRITAGYNRLSGTTTDAKAFVPSTTEGATAERLSFKADGAVYDLSGVYELHFLPYGYERGYQGFHRLVPYIGLGFGFSYGDADKAFTVNFPIALGVKYKIGYRWNAGLAWTMHLTTSDKLEGLEAPYGIKSSGFKNKDHYSALMLTITYDIAPRCPTCNKDRR